VGSETELVRLAASLEQGSEHPLGSAIVAAARENNIPMAGVSDFQSQPGLGISGKVDGRTVAVGNEQFFQQKSISFDALAQTAGDLRHNGQTVVFVVIDGKPAGLIGIADPIKPSTAQALRDLKAAGLRIVMLTGDSRGTAEAVAAKLGIDDFEA
jgi:Cu+-exporting ATPase